MEEFKIDNVRRVANHIRRTMKGDYIIRKGFVNYAMMDKYGWQSMLVNIKNAEMELRKLAERNAETKEAIRLLEDLVYDSMITMSWLGVNYEVKLSDLSNSEKDKLIREQVIEKNNEKREQKELIEEHLVVKVDEGVATAMIDERRQDVDKSKLDKAWNKILGYDVIKDNDALYPVLFKSRPKVYWANKKDRKYKLQMKFGSLSEMGVFLEYRSVILNHLRFLLCNAHVELLCKVEQI